MSIEVGDGLEDQEYDVSVTVSVTAKNPVEAAGFALDDLRDQNLGTWHMEVMDSEGEITEVEVD